MRIHSTAGNRIDLHAVKPPAVAGLFYPEGTQALRQEVTGLLAAARAAPRGALQGGAASGLGGRDELGPKAIISPHAGYKYSGRTAARAFTALDSIAPAVRRIVLLGPAHRVGFNGVAVSSAGVFATPLGHLQVDTGAVASIRSLPVVAELDVAFAQEHSLEVQLPFIQTLLPEVHIVPLLVGRCAADDVADILTRLWGDDDTVVVVSSDLSHFQDYESARRRDHATSKLITALAGDRLADGDACGRIPIQALLQVARTRGLQGSVVDLCNSGDTAGPRERVVGYGAYAFGSNPPGRTGDGLGYLERRHLLGIAASAINHRLAGASAAPPDLSALPAAITGPGASFVTLETGGQLHGCVGSLQARRPLAADVAANAEQAGFSDPRFTALTREEFACTRISISVLTPLRPVAARTEAELLEQLRPGHDGLIIQDGASRATFLPAVWSSLPDRVTFLSELKRKAGLAPGHWSSTLQVWRYTTQTFR